MSILVFLQIAWTSISSYRLWVPMKLMDALPPDRQELIEKAVRQ
jgi:hypothetical protein